MADQHEHVRRSRPVARRSGLEGVERGARRGEVADRLQRARNRSQRQAGQQQCRSERRAGAPRQRRGQQPAAEQSERGEHACDEESPLRRHDGCGGQRQPGEHRQVREEPGNQVAAPPKAGGRERQRDDDDRGEPDRGR
ncbi:hypothetical protein AB0I53_31240 [Saccharopolyspora sp. NPDC050389]|uniref:hypothetical protein n=1 Tax=Saccharopolyspora sp. NPDC050389 TaxID=3155516 RepID=UPI0033F185DF